MKEKPIPIFQCGSCEQQLVTPLPDRTKRYCQNEECPQYLMAMEVIEKPVDIFEPMTEEEKIELAQNECYECGAPVESVWAKFRGWRRCTNILCLEFAPKKSIPSSLPPIEDGVDMATLGHASVALGFTERKDRGPKNKRPGWGKPAPDAGLVKPPIMQLAPPSSRSCMIKKEHLFFFFLLPLVLREGCTRR